uniref:F-box/LRR-repeat protein 20-like n=1 Tax=Saccoglossus kowalevskii TaxID=10224 RepID=A0ABM0LV30_SACKO
MEIKLTFGKNDTVEQMRESLLEAPALDNLVLDECLCIDDNSVLQFIHVINRKLRTLEARKLYKFTDAAVEVIANRCKELQHVKFIGCNNLGQKSIISLGKHCKKLQSIAFIYENGTDWPLVDDVLSVLVGHFTSDLLATTFVGFKGITDIGISYVAECFHESLNAIDFSSCAHVTDGSLIGLATNCRLLRSVAFNSTSISDKGLKALSEKCINLQHVDVGNCVNVTDQSVKYLAEHCTLLEFISVENCKQITDASLRALTLHCGLLQNVNFHNTGVKKIPITILRLAFLVQFDVKMCKELSFPPPEIINKDVDGITDFYRKRHLGYRLRVLFLGNQGSGKSSLVQSLITDTAKLVDHPTDGVNVELWNPFHGVANEVLLERELSPDEKILGLDMWDTSGRT